MVACALILALSRQPGLPGVDGPQAEGNAAAAVDRGRHAAPTVHKPGNNGG
jgi:hypothetical protein